jgi:ribonuclease VapC
MIAADSSALIAIALGESEADELLAIIADHRCVVGWPTLLETYLVLHRRTNAAFGTQFVQEFSGRLNVAPQPFDGDLFKFACAAFEQYGKYRIKGGLNFGDCLSYAVAKLHDVPLLYKGDDFALTDIRSATA